MKKFLKIFILLIILFPINSKALVCSDKDKVYFQELAKNITTTYSYVEENNQAIFNITFSNIPEGFRIYDYTNKKEYGYTASEITLGGYQAGSSYRFDYYTNDILCQYSRLYSSYINLPFYNPYYNDSVCNGLNYKYCNKWQKINMNYEEFLNDVNNYKKSLELDKKEENIEEIKGFFDNVIDFYTKYYYIILPIFIIIAISYIIYYNKKQDLF